MRASCSFWLSFLALALASATGHAGPCEKEIYDANVAVNQRLDAAAARGKTEHQSVGAQLHHQPTPGSIAQAEGLAGDLSEADVRTVVADLAKARDADQAGDRAGCEKALADVRRILGVLER